MNESALFFVYQAVLTNSLHVVCSVQKNDTSTDHFAWKNQIASRNGMLV